MTATPPLPADVDLRGLGWMPLMGDRLFASQTWIRASDAGKIAALKLWWHSFSKEIPASSLPSDDTLLASYAGLTIRKFRLMRDEVMRGWIECSDGRLYHPIVAELALDAWDKRKKYTSSRERDRNRLAEWRARQRQQPGEDETSFTSVTKPVTKRDRNADETHRDRTGHNKTEENPPNPPLVKRVSGRQRRGSNGSNGTSGHAKPDPNALPPPEPWDQRAKGYLLHKFWRPQWGPTPDEPGCFCPPEFLH